MIIERMKKTKHELEKMWGNLIALKQNNITLRQLPYMIREWRLWLQITRNFAVIEGSWLKGFNTYLAIFKGFPMPKHHPQNKLPAEKDRLT